MEVRQGATYCSKTQLHTVYTTINHDDDGKVCEIFVRLDDKDLYEMITLITRLASMALREGTPPLVVAQELMNVYSPVTNHIIPGTTTMCPSIVARIGMVLKDHIEKNENEN